MNCSQNYLQPTAGAILSRLTPIREKKVWSERGRERLYMKSVVSKSTFLKSLWSTNAYDLRAAFLYASTVAASASAGKNAGSCAEDGESDNSETREVHCE